MVVEEASAPSPAACRGAPSRSPCGTPMRRVGAAWPGEGPRGAGRVADEPRGCVEPCLRSPGASRGEAGLRGYLFTVQVVPGYH